MLILKKFRRYFSITQNRTTGKPLAKHRVNGYFASEAIIKAELESHL